MACRISRRCAGSAARLISGCSSASARRNSTWQTQDHRSQILSILAGCSKDAREGPRQTRRPSCCTCRKWTLSQCCILHVIQIQIEEQAGRWHSGDAGLPYRVYTTPNAHPVDRAAVLTGHVPRRHKQQAAALARRRLPRLVVHEHHILCIRAQVLRQWLDSVMLLPARRNALLQVQVQVP